MTFKQWLPKFLIGFLVLLIVVAFLLTGFNPGTQSSKDTVAAEVNSNKIYFTQNSRLVMRYSQQIKQYQSYGIPLNGQYRAMIYEQVLDSFINSQLLLQYADNQGIMVSNEKVFETIFSYDQLYDKDGNNRYNELPQETQDLIFNDQKEMSIEQLVKSDIELAGQIPLNIASESYFHVKQDKYQSEIAYVKYKSLITDEMLVEYYENNSDKFEKMHSAHILVSDEKKAKELVEKLRDDISLWGELCFKYSEGPTNTKGGDLGKNNRNAFVKEFSDAAFALTEKDQISDPVKTQFGYHVIRAIEPPSIPELNSIKKEVQESFYADNKEVLIEKSKLLLKVVKEYVKENGFEGVQEEFEGIEYVKTNDFSFKGSVLNQVNENELQFLGNADEFYKYMVKADQGDISNSIVLADVALITKVVDKEPLTASGLASFIKNNINTYISNFNMILYKNFLNNLKNDAKITVNNEIVEGIKQYQPQQQQQPQQQGGNGR